VSWEAGQPIEMWGGVECTVNRIGDTYYDQLSRCGHDDRLDDLNRIADLGIRSRSIGRSARTCWRNTAPGAVHRPCRQSTRR
jgi:hypothetical protein